MTGIFDDADVIFAYSRAQAIEDGNLVDVTAACQELSIEPLFKWHVAMTRDAWEKFVQWDAADSQRTDTVQDMAGRLWDVMYMAAMSAKQQPPGTDQFIYSINYVDRYAIIPGHRSREGQLKVHVGPGDDPTPVITIMLPEES